MDAESSLSCQIEGVERSVVFLRQEHLTLLHGLHLEILSLQKRCTELTSELKVKPPGKTQIELQEEEELLQARCQAVENSLSEKQYTSGQLRKELSHKGSLVGALRANLKEKERHFLEELKRRSHRSTILNTDLQRQTEEAAFLSFQLHAARQKLHHQRMQQRYGLLTRANGQETQHCTEQTLSQSPQLPPAASPASPVVKPKRKSARPFSGQLRVERARECVPMESVTGPAEPTAMPDPALFLHPRRHRARSRHSPPQRQPPLGLEREYMEEGGGEGLTESQDEAPRMSRATAPPAAQTKAD